MAGDDGVLTLEEGLPAYGGVVIDLQPYPTADADGNVTFEQTFTLEDPSFDLSAHTIVLHGMTLDGAYDGSLPAACGLIMPEGSFVSELSGANERPEPVESEGSGFANYVLTSAGDAIAYTLVVNGLTDVTAAHIHLEDEGADTGGVVVPLFATDVEAGVASDGILASGLITPEDLTGALAGMTLDDLLNAMEAGETYTNVHTVTNPTGELRGQIMLLGAVEPPPPPPAAAGEFHVLFGALNESGVSGTATLTLAEGQLSVVVEASGLDADQEHMLHIHGDGGATQSYCPTPDMAGDDGILSLEEGAPAYGGVVVPLEPYPTADASGAITFDQTYAFDGTVAELASHTIVVHGLTLDGTYDPSLPVACGLIMPQDGFASTLSGENERPEPVESDGSGFATYQMTADGEAIVFVLAIENLEGVTMAHIHQLNEGEGTGGVVAWLADYTDVEGGVAYNGIIGSGLIAAEDLTGALEGMTIESLVDSMAAGLTYTNVHTVTNPAGEIRGDIVQYSGEEHVH